MALALQDALQSIVPPIQFAVGTATYGGKNVAAVALADITQIPCDAYVVPQFRDAAAQGGVTGVIAKAGAFKGMLAYDRCLKELHARRKEPEWGAALVTGSGGGTRGAGRSAEMGMATAAGRSRISTWRIH